MSDHLQLFAKEQERYSTAAQTSDAAPATPKTAPTSKSAARRNAKKSAAKKSGRGENKDAKKVLQMCDTGKEDLDGKGGKKKGGKSRARIKTGNRQSDINLRSQYDHY